MHIPDGFLSTPLWAALDATAVPVIALCARQRERGVAEGAVPLLGVMGAFVFAAQMINFPVGFGTSGHLVGSALLACALGPASAAIVMTAILAVQALVFQDGGLLALGANVFNMAVAGVWAGYLPFRYWGGGAWRRAGIFLGGVLSVLVAATLALLELRLSGVPIPGAVLGVSVVVFLVSALVEGAVTLTVFTALERTDARWVGQAQPADRRMTGLLAAVAVLLASVGALLASGLPDGLDSLAERIGISGRARNLMETPLADYQLRFLSDPLLAKVTAGLAGLAVIYLVCVIAGRVLTRRGSV
jgi:cobalt/nickel transport system permease protein